MAQKPRPVVIPFRRPEPDDEEELPVGLPPSVALASHSERSISAVDLNGKPKVWFATGPGRSGKTTLLRWAFEKAALKGAEVIPAACDPGRRALPDYIEGVAQPRTSDTAETARWLQELLDHAMKHKTSAMIDLGGGDLSLGRLIASMPDLATVLEAEGITPVALYLVGPRVDDLSALASFEAAGFRPSATTVICNDGIGDPTTLREEKFARLLRHSVFRAAIERGAVHLWMPRLDSDAAEEVERKLVHFVPAMEGRAPEGKTPVGPFNRSKIRRWLEDMNREFEPIITAGWLP